MDADARKHSYDEKDIDRCGLGELFGPNVTRLPTGNMLMIDRITSITEAGGRYGK